MQEIFKTRLIYVARCNILQSKICSDNCLKYTSELYEALISQR